MNEFNGSLDGRDRRIAIVLSRFNSLITEQLLGGAHDCLVRHGVAEDAIDVFRVPGAWEIPAAARRVAETGQYDALLALGCVIRGATPHFDYVAGEAARGLGQLSREAKLPIIFGVLTTDTVEQALERAGTKSGNKGWDAAMSALEMASLYDGIG